MEPKFKEQVNRNPNVDLSNTPINQWPIEEKIKTIAAGPAYAAIKSGVFDKVRDALYKFYSAGSNYKGKITPMGPKAGMSKDSKQTFNNGGKIY